MSLIKSMTSFNRTKNKTKNNDMDKIKDNNDNKDRDNELNNDIELNDDIELNKSQLNIIDNNKIKSYNVIKSNLIKQKYNINNNNNTTTNTTNNTTANSSTNNKTLQAIGNKNIDNTLTSTISNSSSISLSINKSTGLLYNSTTTPLLNQLYYITEDKDLTKTILKYGSLNKPAILSRVYGKTSNGIFWSYLNEEYDFILGRGETCKGLEMCISTCNVGERCIITVENEYGFTDIKRPNNCPKSNLYIFDVEILYSEIEKNTYEMTFEEKLEFADRRRLKGNSLFIESKFISAEKHYDSGLNTLNTIDDPTHPLTRDSKINEQQKESLIISLIPLLLNAAACKLKTNDYLTAIKYCTKVLEFKPHQIKALYRRAQAYRHRHEFANAQTDLDQAYVNCDSEEELKVIKYELKLLANERKGFNKIVTSNLSAGFIAQSKKVEESKSILAQLKRVLCCNKDKVKRS